MRNLFLVAALIACSGAGTVRGDTLEGLYKARAEYQRQIVDARSKLEKALSDRISKVAETGDLQAVKAALDEFDAFSRDGFLPTSKEMKKDCDTYLDTQRKAFALVKKAYDSAVIQFTKSLDIAMAERIQREFEELTVRYEETDGVVPDGAVATRKDAVNDYVKLIIQKDAEIRELETHAQRESALRDFFDDANKKLQSRTFVLRVPIKDVKYTRNGTRIYLDAPLLENNPRRFQSSITVRLPKSRALAINPGDILVLRGRPSIWWYGSYRGKGRVEYTVYVDENYCIGLSRVQKRFEDKARDE